MNLRAEISAVVLVLAIACSSASSTVTPTVSPSPTTARYLGSLGNAGCKPPAAFKGWQTTSSLPETGFDSATGSLWALFFETVPPPAGKQIKVVWRMTGSGPFTFRVSDADAKTVAPVWGPEIHGGSNWDHPGGEVGTGFLFPHAGCWNIHVTRSDVAGDLWLEVAG